MEKPTGSLNELSRSQSRSSGGPVSPGAAGARELNLLSAVSLLKWKKNAVGPRVLGFKVRTIILNMTCRFCSLGTEEKEERGTRQSGDTRTKQVS